MEKETLKKRLDACILEENELRFHRFGIPEALELGNILYKNAAEKSLPVALDVEVNDFQIFHICLKGAAPYNNLWIQRKLNMVRLKHISSLHAGYMIEYQGQKLEEDWLLDPKEYAIKGGGFPILLKDGTCIGGVCCSGLPHEEDHKLVVDSIRELLKQEE